MKSDREKQNNAMVVLNKWQWISAYATLSHNKWGPTFKCSSQK